MTLPELVFRKATVDDVELLDQWRTETAAFLDKRYGGGQWLECYSRARFEQWIAEEATEIVSLTGSDEPVGTITTSLNGDIRYWTIDELLEPALYLYRINVAPAWFGNRIGEAMIAWAGGTAKQLSVDRLRLEVWTKSQRLHDYYVSLGFTRNGANGNITRYGMS